MSIEECRDTIDLFRDAAIVVVGRHIVAANDSMSSVSGYTVEELLGKAIGELVSLDFPGFPSADETDLVLPMGISGATLRRKSGEKSVLSVVARCLDGDGWPRHILLVFAVPPGSSGESTVCSQDTLLLKCLEADQSAVMVIGRTGRIALVNRMCCHLLGYERLDLIGAPWVNVFVTPGHRDVFSNYFEHGLAPAIGSEQSYEVPMTTRGGLRITVQWNASTLTDDRDGRLLGVVLHGLDITNQKLAAQVHEDLDRQYKLVAGSVGVATWYYDLVKRRSTHVSDAIAQMVGFTAAEISEMPFERLFPGHSCEMAVSELERHLEVAARIPDDQPCSWSLELEHVTKNGTTIWVESTSRLVRDSLGQTIGIVGVTRDISERKRAERSLQESETRYRSLFENSMDAICIVSPDGRIKDLNCSALDMFGYSRSDMTSLSLADLMGAADLVRFKRAIRERGFVRNLQMALLRKDGSRLDCLLTVAMRRDEEGNITGYEGSIRDITRYKRLRENLRVYVKEATIAQEKERHRLSCEIHDGLLQDLLALGVMMEEAIRSQDRSLAFRLEQLVGMRAEVSRLAKDTRRVSQALGPGVLEQLGLFAAIREMLQSLEGVGIETKFTSAGNEENLRSDLELALYRMAQEAVNNIKRHSGAQRVQIELDHQPGVVTMTIADDGRGFEVPHRLSNFAAAKKLGLTGMEQRAKMLGGHMVVRSRPNGGTSIRIEIPRATSLRE